MNIEGKKEKREGNHKTDSYLENTLRGAGGEVEGRVTGPWALRRSYDVTSTGCCK